MEEIIEEEVLVVASMEGLEEVLGKQTDNIVLEINEKGDIVHATLNDQLLLSGNFEISLGTQLIFEEATKNSVSSDSSNTNMKEVRCIGTSITNLPLQLRSTVDIDKLNSTLKPLQGLSNNQCK